MNRDKYTTDGEKGKHLCLWERKEIAKALLRGAGVREIARALERSPSTISREIKRGSVPQRRLVKSHSKRVDIPLEVTENRYFSDVGQRVARNNTGRRGGKYKLFEDMYFVRYIEDKILKDRWSPDAITGWIKTQGITFMTSVCTKTIYNYIDRGLLAVKNIDLLLKPRLKQKKKRIRQHKRQLGTSIDFRPKEIETREEFGHWEGDTVVGKDQKSAILTLVERQTTEGFILKLKDRSASTVNNAIRGLQKVLGSMTFKSITFDNGSEFSRAHKLERYGTQIYFAHPYSAYERGGNENYNGIIRRYFKKGTDFRTVTQAQLNRVNHAINALPRKKHGYKTAEMMFIAALENAAQILNVIPPTAP